MFGVLSAACSWLDKAGADTPLPAQDAVARSAKRWMLYKRPGQRVLINERGDMLVRPSFAELSIQQSPKGPSVYHVRLLSLACSSAMLAGPC